MFDRYTSILHRGRWWFAVLFISLFVLSLGEARHLKLKNDFKELLPEKFQSVVDLNRIVERVGGTGSLIVAIQSDDPEASIRFGEDLVVQLKEYPPEFINRIEINASEAKKMIEGSKFLFVDLDDIREIYSRLDRSIQRQKLKKTGLLMSFETPEEQKGFTTTDIEDKYKARTANYDNYLRGYFFDADHKVMAVVLKPPGSSTGLDFSRKLVTKVYQTISELDPLKYHPSMKVGLTGKFRRTLFEYQALVDDIRSTALLCVALVGLAVFLYFRRLRMVCLMAWATFNGTFWTFAITAVKIGYLTTQTAFLGSIIIGNGINYGLILMARYLEERKRGHNPFESMRIAFSATFSGTLASSLTTSVAFATLMITDIRGFSQFGFIGGLGMFLCWVATYTVLPVFLWISEDIWPVIGEKKEGADRWFHFSFPSYLSTKLVPNASRLARLAVALTIISIPLIIHFVPRSLEYNFTKLRTKTKGQEVSEEADWNKKVKKIFNASLSPVILVADRTEDVDPLCREIMHKNEIDPSEKKVIDSCKSLYSYVPPDQDEKIAWLKKIRDLIDKNTLGFLSREQKDKMAQFKKDFAAKHVRLEDLSPSIVANFTEKNGDVGKIVYVYPTDKAPLWNGKNLIRFASLIRENKLPDGRVVTGSGESVIFADLLSAVVHDGPRATWIAFLAVCLVVVLIFREKKGILFIIGTLTMGVLLMGGLLSILGIKINFFNFIAIPTTFGIGVDYGCNIYQRYKLEGKGSLPHVLKTTGGAVALCSLTTVIGYFTLIIAKNQALVSFGWIAIIGEVACLVTALVFIPAIVMRRESGGKL